MRDVRKNQIKSILYHVLIAFITYIFIMGKYIYYVMPYSAGIFLLLFISLGMTLKDSEVPGERASINVTSLPSDTDTGSISSAVPSKITNVNPAMIY